MKTKSEREVRYFPIELRVEKGENPKIVGYASVFNSYSEDLGGFREKVRPGAFKKTLAEADVRALLNHDANYVLGRSKNGTLKLKEDSTGLFFEVDPPETQWARDLMVSIDRGDIDQTSFAFRTIRDEWRKEDGKNERELVEVDLLDVSVVTYPAYPQTVVAVRSIAVEDINRIALGAEHNIPLTDQDKQILRENISALNRLAGAPDPEVHPPAEVVPTPVPEDHLGKLRRQCDLADADE